MSEDSDIDVGVALENRLSDAFDLVHLEVSNESHQHNVPENSQTHFKVVLVSEDFSDVGRVQRHRSINLLVKDLLAGPVHALALHPYTTSCLLYTSPSPRDKRQSRMPSSA